MYVPPHFRGEDDAIRQFVADAEFGLLISNGAAEQAPEATHLPVMAQSVKDEVLIDCHMARANPQWKDLEGESVLLVLQGAGAYVSPAWYDTPDVPTWNYQAVHLQARASYLSHEAFRDHLLSLVERHESKQGEGINPYDWDAAFVENQMRGAVGLRLIVSRLDGAFKLSQNKSGTEQKRIAKHLSQGDASSMAIARAMKRHSDKVND